MGNLFSSQRKRPNKRVKFAKEVAVFYRKTPPLEEEEIALIGDGIGAGVANDALQEPNFTVEENISRPTEKETTNMESSVNDKPKKTSDSDESLDDILSWMLSGAERPRRSESYECVAPPSYRIWENDTGTSFFDRYCRPGASSDSSDDDDSSYWARRRRRLLHPNSPEPGSSGLQKRTPSKPERKYY